MIAQTTSNGILDLNFYIIRSCVSICANLTFRIHMAANLNFALKFKNCLDGGWTLGKTVLSGNTCLQH